ncbi:MAG: rhodanese-related sulfurtransferase [Pseudomonadota bacterium]
MITVATFYRFADLPDPALLRGRLAALGAREAVRGTVLIAAEGVNGTIAGQRDGIERVLAHIRRWPGCAGLAARYSAAEAMPFARLKVRLKREIVTMGAPEARPTERVGHYVDPAAWNALIQAPDVAVIDTRNDYEIRLGTFDGAEDPGLKSFSEFPAWWDANAHRVANKRVAMFCTGGIRCEKSTAFLKAQGVDEVYHLKGGILSYLEETPMEESRWQGECFVFDQRVALRHGLAQGEAGMCHACRRPVTQADMAGPHWEEGVSCPACIDTFEEEDRARFRERQRQIGLAKARGERHLA